MNIRIYTVALISVADKSMTGGQILTAIQYRTSGFYLRNNKIVPVGLVHFGSFLIRDSRIVTEMIN